jgi:phage/plasmid-associated DNA primase
MKRNLQRMRNKREVTTDEKGKGNLQRMQNKREVTTGEKGKESYNG